MRDSRVLALKKRLSESGDLDMADSGEDLYDEALPCELDNLRIRQ